MAHVVPLPEGALLLTTREVRLAQGHGDPRRGPQAHGAVDATPDEDEDLPADAPRPDHILDKALELLREKDGKPA